MAIESVSPEIIIAFVLALAGYAGAGYKAWQAKNYKTAAEAGAELISEVIDFFDPELPEANTAPDIVKERFCRDEIPVCAADGLMIGDIEVVGLYSEWKRYETQHQIPLTTIMPGQKISVPFLGLRAGNAYVGLKVDDQVYDTKHFNVRSDMIGHPLEIFFTMPHAAPGTHQISVVEGYKTNSMSYDTDPCWFDESKTYPVEVTKKPVDTFVIST